MFLLTANAAFADYATVSSPYIGNSGSGAAMLLVGGSNGTWALSDSGTAGSLPNLSDVTQIGGIILLAQPGGGIIKYSQCSLVIPQGTAASVSYTASMTGSGGTVYVQIGSSTFYAPSAGTTSGSVTLSSGTYFLKAYGTAPAGGSFIQISVNITYP